MANGRGRSQRCRVQYKTKRTAKRSISSTKGTARKRSTTWEGTAKLTTGRQSWRCGTSIWISIIQWRYIMFWRQSILRIGVRYLCLTASVNYRTLSCSMSRIWGLGPRIIRITSVIWKMLLTLDRGRKFARTQKGSSLVVETQFVHQRNSKHSTTFNGEQLGGFTKAR